MGDVLENLRETWAMMELSNSIQKQFHDYGPEGTKIFQINGEDVRNKLATDFIGGGHHYVYPFIPLEEIWIEHTLSEEDQRKILAHEMVERMLMKHLHMKYQPGAHDIANNVETELRRGNGDPSVIFDKFCKNHFKKPELQNMGRQLALAYLGY